MPLIRKKNFVQSNPVNTLVVEKMYTFATGVKHSCYKKYVLLFT